MSEATPTKPSRRAAWIIVLSSAGCIGFLAFILLGALEKRREAEEFVEDDLADRPGLVDPGGVVLPQGGCGTADPEKPPAMTVELDEQGVDFGDLKQGQVVEKRVYFKSTGKGRLCVVRAETTCGCLKVTLDDTDREYEPDERGYVLLRIDTTGRAEPVNKNVVIITNDLDKPRHVFPVKAQISRGLVISPGMLAFGQTALRTESTGSLFLRVPKDQGELEIQAVRGTRAIDGDQPLRYRYELEPYPGEDPKYNRYTLKVTAPPIAQEGSFVDRVVLRTNLPEYEEVSVKATHLVSPRIRPAPLRFAMGSLRAGVKSPRPVRVRLLPASPTIQFSIQSVEVESKDGRSRGAATGYEATFGETRGTWWVELVYTGQARQPGRLNAVVIVRTDDPRQSELRIDVRGTVRPTR